MFNQKMEEQAMLPMLRKNRASFPSLIDEFLGRDMLDSVFANETGISTPAVNVIETGDDFRIEVAAPGLEKKDFNIDLDGRMLTISSEKEFNKEEKEERFMRREFGYTRFSRSFSLPELVDVDKIKATHKNGILNISIPKMEQAKQKPPKQIAIS
jgi:HSP20 family protein